MKRQYRAELAPWIVLLAVLTLAAPPLLAQEATGDTATETPSPTVTTGDQPVEQEIVEIRHADPSEIRRVLLVFPLHVPSHESLGLITLRGARADLDAAVAVARRLDVPRAQSPSDEVVAHVLRGSRAGGAGGEGGARGEVTPGLTDVAEQLRNVFGFRRVELLDTLVVRAADRAAGQVKGFLSRDGSPVGYRFGFNRLDLLAQQAAEGDRQVRLNGLVFETDSAGGDVRLVTDLEVREGQKAVVGKAASGREQSESLIVVVEIRVLD
jgi:hypothetical protein